MSRSVAAAAVYSALSVWVACFGGVLQKWSCETSEISEHEITAYHGETIEMQCQMLSYGRVVSGCGVCAFLWQTNGMGSAWWPTNATCSSGYVKFSWTPEFDTGADDVRFFFRVTDAKGANYRANGTLRLLGSPYGDARYLPLPQKVIDFNQVTILNPTNAPWPVKGEDMVTPNQVTNIAARVVTNDVASWALKPGASPVFVEKDPTVWLSNSTVYASGTNVTFLTEHQSLSFTNGYRRIDDKINWLDVTNHSDFVTESVTNGLATTNYVYEMIDRTNVRFSNEVLSVGLGIDTNSVAVLNEIAASFGGFPLSTGETATTVGGLLLALAAAVAWLKQNKLTKGLKSTGEPEDPNVSLLFTSSNTSFDAANMNYTASGETTTTVKAKIQSIETAVGTANSDLEDAIGGNY